MDNKFKIDKDFATDIYIGELDKTVVMIAGRAGNGKGVASAVIHEYLEADGRSVEEHNMADVMREVARLLGWNGNKSPAFRRFMQQFGTDVVRNILGEDVWINLWFKVARRSHAEYILVNDVRFKNELELLRNYSADSLTLKIVGIDDDFTDYNHASEQGIPDEMFDQIIKNDRTDGFKDLIKVEAGLLTLKGELYDDRS